MHEHELDRRVEGRRYDSPPEPSFVREASMQRPTPTPMTRPVTTSPIRSVGGDVTGTGNTGNKPTNGNRGGF
jgi:hypothetical protein